MLLAATLLVVLSPLLALIVVAVRLDTRGPLLFRQERCGRALRPFVVLKFRSMHYGASSDAHRRYIAHLLAAGVDATPGLKKLTGDTRVTRRRSLTSLSTTRRSTSGALMSGPG